MDGCCTETARSRVIEESTPNTETSALHCAFDDSKSHTRMAIDMLLLCVVCLPLDRGWPVSLSDELLLTSVNAFPVVLNPRERLKAVRTWERSPLADV